MTTLAGPLLRSAFYAAARRGWKEITGESLPDTLPLGEEFWIACQQTAARQPYADTRLGLGFRAGRCGFSALLDQAGHELGLRTPDFRLHPVPTRLAAGFEILSAACRQSGFALSHAIQPDGFCLRFLQPLSEVQRGYWMGFFQEFFEWASQGRVYPLIAADDQGFCFASEPLNL